MNTKGVRSAIDIIRDASKKDLIIVSLFLLPILLGSWSYLLNSLDFLNQHDVCKLALIGFILAVYVVGLVVMKRWDPEEEKLKRARYHIENILKKRVRASFEYLGKEVPTYTPDFLKKLILKYPTVFRDCPIKRHGPGITLVKEESIDHHQTAP
jgi:hypothetical protein